MQGAGISSSLTQQPHFAGWQINWHVEGMWKAFIVLFRFTLSWLPNFVRVPPGQIIDTMSTYQWPSPAAVPLYS